MRHLSSVGRPALSVLLVGLAGHVGSELGFALKFPPHQISPFWPTNAILFAVLVMTPVRHWWAYTLAAFASPLWSDARAGFPLSAALFVLADLIEVFIAAVGVRRLAGGPRAFARLGNLVVYIVVAAVLAPATSAFVGALAGTPGAYWFYWRVWLLSDALPYLTLAPAIIVWIDRAPTLLANVSPGRVVEACVLGGGLLAVSGGAFGWPTATEETIPALVYLPLPLLLWAAVRFGPLGVNTSLVIVTALSISGTVLGRGPFAGRTPAEHVLELQLFLFTMSVPLMFLAALIEERRERTIVLSESEAQFRAMADTAPILIWVAGPDKGCTFLNRGWLDFTGRTLAQELGTAGSRASTPTTWTAAWPPTRAPSMPGASSRWSTASAGVTASTACSWTGACPGSRRTGRFSGTSGAPTTVCRAVKRLLRAFGMDAEAFASGEQFIDAITASGSRRVDCVVLDLQMPGMSGLQVQERLAGLSRRVPIVFVTAHEEAGARERALAAGAVAFVRKPFSDEMLIDALRAAIFGTWGAP